MYAGTTLKQFRNLDSWFGAHQNIDRLARRVVSRMLSEKMDGQFPSAKQIISFEGIDGPDAIKRKTPAQDEPWHFYDPYDDDDTQLLAILATHRKNLVEALREGNATRASFEAAWLAHALVDGLTPAHHYPYEKELVRLRGGESIETRSTPKGKLLLPGETIRERMSNNWSMWGDKGLLATHLSFEWGIAILLTPMSASRFETPTKHAKRVAKTGEYEAFFDAQAKRIADLKLYEDYYRLGWTPGIAQRARNELVPIIVETLSVYWYGVAKEGLGKKK